MSSTIAYEVTDAAYAIEKTNPPVLIVTAKGNATSAAWTQPTLEPNVYIHPPEDGIYTFELFAVPPPKQTAAVISPIEGEARLEIKSIPTWFKGIRVKAKANEKVVTYD